MNIFLFSLASLVDIPISITSSAVGLRTCVITARIKKFKSIIKEEIMDFLISKALIDFYINHDKFVTVNNVLREYNEINKEIKNLKNAVEYTKAMETYCVSCKKNTTNENSSVRRSKQNRLTLLLNCAICGKKRSNFGKNQQASGLLSEFGIRTPLTNIPLTGDILFH